jgi:hypothetical protein
MNVRLIPCLLAAVLMAGCATSFPQQPLNLLGIAAPANMASETIVLKPDTTYVNVTGGDVVQFVSGTKTFAWSFDGPLEIFNFDLMRVAPAGMLDHPVTVYIAPNPMYRNYPD